MPVGTHSITFDISAGGMRSGLEQVERYYKWVQDKTMELGEQLANIGYHMASIQFDAAWYTGDNDVSVELQVNEKQTGSFKIIASGRAVCFIEFGAGVYYNGSESYPGKRPSGVVGIGEYGMHHGRQDYWTYLDTDGQPQITHGTPASAPMFHSVEEMKEQFLTIAREVFG